MRQSGVTPDPRRINAAFRPTAALNLGGVPACAPAGRCGHSPQGLFGNFGLFSSISVQKKAGRRRQGRVTKRRGRGTTHTTSTLHSTASLALQAFPPGETGIQVVPELDILFVLLPAQENLLLAQDSRKIEQPAVNVLHLDLAPLDFQQY